MTERQPVGRQGDLHMIQENRPAELKIQTESYLRREENARLPSADMQDRIGSYLASATTQHVPGHHVLYSDRSLCKQLERIFDSLSRQRRQRP